MTVYGIPNCDTVQKALAWLKANQIEFEFHNFKTAGIEPKKLKQWNKKAGLEAFLNKKSATWRGFDDTQKEAALSFDGALPIFLEKTSLIKRPVIEDGDFLFFGFDEGVYQSHFLKR